MKTVKLAAIAVTATLVLGLSREARAAVTVTMDSEQVLFWVNNTWMLVAAFLVFIMHIGFAALESGLTQAKNTVNVLFKNFSILAIGLLTYALMGFGLMYPGEAHAGQLIGFAGFGIGTDSVGLTSAYADGAYTYWTDFIFQAMFAATAATIVSGAVAERVKLSSFLIFSTLYVAVIYPLIGMWQWGGGWLSQTGFHDFAGSTIVHTVGGWAALTGACILGPRLGRYRADGSNGLTGSSLPLATIGALLLWFGWYGFNGGSVLSANPAAVSYVVVTTTLAAASGVIAAAAASWISSGKPDLAMALNGALAGLVGITAGADVIAPLWAVVVGLASGLLVVVATAVMDRLRIDDPVGAVPVHLVCGIWGTLAVGLFSPEVSVASQLIGIGAAAALCLPSSLLIFYCLDHTLGMRVSEEGERQGLDLHEHGTVAWSLTPTSEPMAAAPAPPPGLAPTIMGVPMPVEMPALAK